MRNLILIAIIMLAARQVFTLPSNLGRGIQHCPHIRCAAVFIPPQCRRPTYLKYQGRTCRGCDKNVCQNGYPI
ncbi:hypothetical protein ACJMK2_043226 [Sinanodonta woodiana]|uniref:Uncharacterized protein n=1 Tax=Sinanodonta woodiana TaxID=1069815 RepID=A0ABD3VW92_SINWO